MSQRPVLDEEFINTNVILKMEQNIIKSLNLNNYYLNVFLQSKLEEARKLVIENKKYNKRVYEFEFAGRTLAIDDNFNLLGNIIGITRQWDPRTGIMTLKFNGQSHTINVNEIDFNVREEQIQNRLKELSLYFSQNSVKDLSMISQALEQTGELTKIEKFTLPIIGSTGRKKPYVIYVATYNNKIILLNNYEEIGRTENVSLNRYVGMTSSDPKVSAIYSENIGVLNDGMIFTTLPAKLIQNKALDILAGRIKETISQQDLDIEIQKYKTSENYIDEEEFEVVNETLRSLASQKFKQLSSEEKQELFEQVKKQSDKFIVSMKNGTIDVATLFGDKNIISFEAKRQILYNSQGIGIYNEFCKEIAKTNVTKKKGGKVMNTVDGNIIYSQTPQQLYEEAWYNRKKYADAIEELMMNREKYSEVEYKQRLTKLMQNRDAAQQVMSKYFNQVSQKSFTHAQQENLQSQSTQQSFDTKTYEEKMRKDYGYEDMTDDERVEFDAKLEETKRKSDKSSSEKDKLIILKEEILKHGQVPNLDEILRQLELDERQRKELEQLLREQEENIECTNRTFH